MDSFREVFFSGLVTSPHNLVPLHARTCAWRSCMLCGWSIRSGSRYRIVTLAHKHCSSILGSGSQKRAVRRQTQLSPNISIGFIKTASISNPRGGTQVCNMDSFIMYIMYPSQIACVCVRAWRWAWAHACNCRYRLYMRVYHLLSVNGNDLL